MAARILSYCSKIERVSGCVPWTGLCTTCLSFSIKLSAYQLSAPRVPVSQRELHMPSGVCGWRSRDTCNVFFDREF
jgi:hypothetical protein